MKSFVALLRAVNVGGTGKLPMGELKAMCEAAGFAEVRTFIASGNVVFKSAKSEPAIKAAPNRTVAIFLDKPPGAKALAEITGQAGEEVRLGKREIYVHYGDGMGKSKLKIKAAADGTARNMNTIAKLTALLG